MVRKRPRLFDEFELWRFGIKTTGLFMGTLGFGSLCADYSYWVADLRDEIKAGGVTIFYIYGVWSSSFFGLELVRLKLRHDLAILRWERAHGRQRSRSRATNR